MKLLVPTLLFTISPILNLASAAVGIEDLSSPQLAAVGNTNRVADFRNSVSVERELKSDARKAVNDKLVALADDSSSTSESQQSTSNPSSSVEDSKPATDSQSKEKDSFSVNDVPAKCSSETFTVKTKGDIKEISNCKILVGNLEITDFEDALIQFGDIERIVGSLKIRRSPNLVRVEAPKVTFIDKSFSLRELTSLALISFPSLKSVKVLDWKVLPILSNVNFNNDIEDIESIVVSDTSLVGFSGFMTDKLETLDINNNRFLDSITSNVEKINGELHIAANSKDVVVNLPDLKSVNNVSIHDVAEINLGSLEEVSYSTSISDNFFSILKLPKLKNVGGTLSLSKNEKLSQVEFPSLGEIGGGLMVVNNTLLDKINFFPKLYTIGGGLDLVGNIKETTLKNLKLVKGSARVKSTASAFDCAKWSRSEISSVIRGGKIECTNSKNENISTNTPTDDDPNGAQGSLRSADGQSGKSRFSLRQSSDSWSLKQVITSTQKFAAIFISVLFI